MTAPPEPALRGVQEMYDRDAPAYQALRAESLSSAGARAIAGLDLAAASVVLDVACGTGAGIAQLRRIAPQARVFGLDLSAQMLRRVEGAHALAQADAARLPVKTAAADALLCCFALMHVPSPAAAIAEFARALRPRGGVAITTWGAVPAWPVRAALLGILDDVGAPAVPSSHHGGAATDTADKVAGLLRAAGFADVVAEAAPFEHRFADAETALSAITSLGSTATRVHALDRGSREEFFRRARKLMSDVDSSALVEPDEAIYAWGRRS